MKNSIKAVEIESFGGPENMQLVDKPVPVPGPGEVRVRLAAIGVNLIDTYHRTGLYQVPLPSGLGVELGFRRLCRSDCYSSHFAYPPAGFDWV